MKPETMLYIFKVCRKNFKVLYVEMLLIQSPSFWKDNVNTYLEVQIFLYHVNAQDWWRKRVYINQISDKKWESDFVLPPSLPSLRHEAKMAMCAYIYLIFAMEKYLETHFDHQGQIPVS